jgi:hypothetical protein
MIGAALLDTRIYEEVEADRRCGAQAVGVVLLAGVADGIGFRSLTDQDPRAFAIAVVGALLGWMAWAALTYFIGTRLLPEPQTKADIGELLRTIAFAASPGFFRACGAIPVVGDILYLVASLWMLAAMVVAVRQALDYTTTGRAVAVCVVGWALSVAIAVTVGVLFPPTVQ